ncbi:hypothetical protein I203_105357 [Kwoniella mangroviensis CBS 8507]|uniref:uncharacterized protein n=1 Tax=Kwoniella mangroviensis CBS 8507 TaxID=1296122 RepID=UPI00080D3AA6|nr:uncharacterized protein I203_01174 [Kwoniella mangroviensis CBS 8507]OCF69318.1 hypothetical protein I203_01174 [Kwoniella mangroviensis CBS 8507]
MDFNALGSISGKSSMRRKSLLQAFGKSSSSSSSSRQSAIPLPSSSTYTSGGGGGGGGGSLPGSAQSTPLTSTTSTFNHDEIYSPSFSPEYQNHPHYHADTISLASRTTASHTHGPGPGTYGLGGGYPHGHGHGGGRSTSANYSIKEKNTNNEKGERNIKRPEDVFRLVRERIIGWSYLGEWYQGDTHWLNTVRIPRSTLESSIGPKQLESRARNFHILGISLSSLFDIPSSNEFLKALLKLLDEWETFSDSGGGKGVKNLFRGQRNNRKVTAGGTVMSDFASGMDSAETYLLNVNMPFIPDFYQTHSTLCSIIRDIYKKLLGMFLPSPPSGNFIPPPFTNSSLLHPSTIIQSAPLEIPFGMGNLGPTPKSPAASIITATFANQQSQVTSPTSEGGHGHVTSYFGGTAQPHTQQFTSPPPQGDALQLFIAGELPSDRTLVGDGQKLTPQIVDMFSKVDTKLKKQFSSLLREGDTLARKVLDDELQIIMQSLNPGSKSFKFDLNAAVIGSGNGWINSASNPSHNNSGYMQGTISGYGGLQGLIEEDRKERDFGTI